MEKKTQPGFVHSLFEFSSPGSDASLQRPISLSPRASMHSVTANRYRWKGLKF